ncbi:MAG TPA: chorismate synthase [Bacillota bacterium]
MRFITAGESHGPGLTAVIEGYPALVEVEPEQINRELQRRQKGYGRGGRMKVEKDEVIIVSGVRKGRTLGSPITIQIKNRDWANWAAVMSPVADANGTGEMGGETRVRIEADQRLATVQSEVTAPRPGHADLSGALKYGFSDLRNVLERASARETAVRVGVGAFAKILLARFGVFIGSHVLQIGKVRGGEPRVLTAREQRAVDETLFRCSDPAADQEMKKEVDLAAKQGESLGGIFVVYATGVVPGLGSHVHWDRRLDGLLAQGIMSIPGIKGLEFGLGFAGAGMPGSVAHDPIYYTPERGYYRKTNHAGGLEGGMTNGEPLLIRVAMKPIPTLYNGLPTVDLRTGQQVKAAVERSDLTAVPAAGVVAEAMVAWVLADAYLQKFGGDSLPEIHAAWQRYTEMIKWRPENV